MTNQVERGSLRGLAPLIRRLRRWPAPQDSKAQVDAQNKRAPRDAMPYNVCCWSLVAADNQLMKTEGGHHPVHDYSSKTARSGL